MDPEEGVADEEVADLATRVVEDERVPLRVEAELRVRVLVEMRAVEVAEPVPVAREVRGDPVEDHADAALVQRVDEVHEIVRPAEAARRRVVADRLVAPRAVERMLGDRQQLDVRVAHPLDVVRELRRHLAVREPPSVLLGIAPPRAEVDLVDRHRVRARVARGARGDPVGVVPLVAVELRDLRRGLRANLGGEAVRVGLLAESAAVGTDDAVLVERPGLHAGNEPLPDTRLVPPGERMGVGAPAVEVADDRHVCGVRRPDGEVDAGNAVHARAGARPASRRCGSACPRRGGGGRNR